MTEQEDEIHSYVAARRVALFRSATCCAGNGATGLINIQRLAVFTEHPGCGPGDRDGYALSCTYEDLGGGPAADEGAVPCVRAPPGDAGRLQVDDHSVVLNRRRGWLRPPPIGFRLAGCGRMFKLLG
ncbi:hypothetical protein [Kitasatospora sp. McL0602]|uniref:hypothetical protein n=1 Tax=Kitasatospora sp. McL0602 TaxID=3439530 RepID=UPI003F8C2618